MKVSILTYHDEDNYGATLQAYATYKAIEQLGHQPEFIDLKLPNKGGLVNKIVFFIKRLRFNRFRNRFFLRKTAAYHSLEELRQNPPLSDVYLIGSDQTWNPEISKDLALAYWLDFGADSIKRISYAASFGKAIWEDSIYAPTEKVAALLKRFSRVLVRENTAVDICKEMFGVNAQQVVDPVLLFDDYKEVIGDVQVDKNKVIVYKLVNSTDFYDKVLTFTKKNGQQVHSIGSLRRLKGYVCKYPVGVEGWMKEFATANTIFTDSFHGTVLSLIFRKQFVVYVGDPKRLTRIKSLLASLGLENRICSSEVSEEALEEIINTSIDYSEVTTKLNKLRENSWTLLKNSI